MAVRANLTGKYIKACKNILESTGQELIRDIMTHLGNRRFMFHHAQVFAPFAVMKAYEAEEAGLVPNECPVSKSSLPSNANVVYSHTAYRIKTEDDD